VIKLVCVNKMTHNLFVGNLSWTTTNETLLSFFQHCSDLISVEVQLHEDNRRSKGWGLASFSNKESAESAIKELNSKELDGRPVHIRLDRNFTNDDEASDNIIPVFVGNLPWSVTNEDLAGYFVDFSPVNCNLLTNMYGKSRGFAIVNFNNIVDAERAISIVNGIDISGRVIECRLDRGPDNRRDGRTNNSVYVGNLDKILTDDGLFKMFIHIGGVVSASVQRNPADNKSKKWGIVKFVDANHANLAVANLNGAPYGYKKMGLKVRLDRK